MSATAPWLHDNPSVVLNNSGTQSHLKLLVRLRRKPAISPLDGVGPLLFSEKVDLKSLHDTLMTAITSFGNDIEVAPKKGYVSLRRKKQFAMIQPTTATRLDIGFILKDVPPTERLESASSFNALFTHRVRVNTINDVDEQVITWLKQADDLAG